MNKRINIKLNQFFNIPSSLREDGSQNRPATEISLNLGQLYHHYYMDSYNKLPPDPNPAAFEYLRFLSNREDFRFLGNGPGFGTAKRRAISTELGQAFCRWFLYEHLRITYFAHIEHVLNKPTHPAFDGLRVSRAAQGDVPDYLCARSVTKIFIAEAKGRFSSISFGTREFQSWRDQFSRIKIEDRFGRSLSLKGYIVGTRFASESNRESTITTLYVEDPKTLGDLPIDSNNNDAFGIGVIALHYATPVLKIGLHLLSAALADGFSIPKEIELKIGVWECLHPILRGIEFAGGVYTYDKRSYCPFLKLLDHEFDEIVDLSRSLGVFVGIELSILRQIRKAVAADWHILGNLETLQIEGDFPGQINLLRDGTITGPPEFFKLLRVDIL